MENNTRKQDVLKVIVETFVHTNQPVGSLQIVEQLPYEISSATVRNDMSEMTELGLLGQPHTSAGRVPTELGYRHYVKMLSQDHKQLSNQQREAVDRQFKQIDNFEARYKLAAKVLADISGSIGFVMDDSQKVYISGLANIVRLPEFANQSFGIKLVEIMEQPENFIKSLKPSAQPHAINVLIGQDARINNATVVISNFGPTGKRVISIIGPMRMQYNKALPLLEHMKKLLDEF